jgi:hypothetical protein
MLKGEVYKGTALSKSAIKLNALKLLESLARQRAGECLSAFVLIAALYAVACCCDALVFLFYHSPVTPLPERR